MNYQRLKPLFTAGVFIPQFGEVVPFDALLVVTSPTGSRAGIAGFALLVGQALEQRRGTVTAGATPVVLDRGRVGMAVNRVVRVARAARHCGSGGSLY